MHCECSLPVCAKCLFSGRDVDATLQELVEPVLLRMRPLLIQIFDTYPTVQATSEVKC